MVEEHSWFNVDKKDEIINLFHDKMAEQQTAYYDYIKNFSCKEKRKIHSNMKNSPLQVSIHSFFPQIGFTAGEFFTFTFLVNKKKVKIFDADGKETKSERNE